MSTTKKINKLLRKYVPRFRKAQRNVEEQRTAWNEFEVLFRDTIDILQSEYVEKDFGTSLFIQDEGFGRQNLEIHNRKHLALRFGLKPLEIREIERDNKGRIVKASQEIEDGAALFFSQGIRGQVYVYLLPAKNKLVTARHKIVMLKVYSTPTDITETNLLRHIKQLFWFALVTGFMSRLSNRDHYRILYYKLRSRSLEWNWAIVLPALILLVSLVHLVLFLMYVI